MGFIITQNGKSNIIKDTKNKINSGIINGGIKLLRGLGFGQNLVKTENTTTPTKTTNKKEETATATPQISEDIPNYEDTNKQTNENAEATTEKVEDEQNKRWEREDSAYQRMVADMRKAGINPNLFAGSPVTVSSGNTATGDWMQSVFGTIANLMYNEITENLNLTNEQKERTKDIANNTVNDIIKVVTTAILAGAK